MFTVSINIVIYMYITYEIISTLNLSALIIYNNKNNYKNCCLLIFKNKRNKSFMLFEKINLYLKKNTLSYTNNKKKVIPSYLINKGNKNI